MAAYTLSLNSALPTFSNNIKSTFSSALPSHVNSSLNSNFLSIAPVPVISRSLLVLNRRTPLQGIRASTRRQRFESHCLKPSESDDGKTAKAEPSSEEDAIVISATPVVMGFYDAINRRDRKVLADLIAENCEFNDLQFPQAFQGKKAVLKFLEDLMEAMGNTMQFAIEGIVERDDCTTMVLWHLEWKGKAIPFTKGCSLYHCERHGTKLLIRFVQGFMEPPIKPGELVLRFLKIISSLFEQFPIVAQSIL